MADKLTAKVLDSEVAALVSALGVSPTAQQIVRRMAFELDRIRDALREIRESGDNEDPAAARMQKIAAWALEPEMWEKPE